MLLVLGVEECHRIVLSFMNLRSMLNYLTTTSGLGRLSQLPDCGLQSLTFSSFFNQSIEFQLPSSLLDLTFGEDFNMSLDNVALPRNLQHLTFGFYFNKCIQNVAFPSGLKSLSFGDKFNMPVLRLTKQCPCLTDVIFGKEFTQLLYYDWHNLERITFGGGKNFPYEETIFFLRWSTSLQILQLTPWVMDADVEPRAFGQLTYLQNLIFTFHTDKKHRRLAKAYAWKNYLSQVVDVMDVCVPACTVNILTILSGRADDAIFSAMADGTYVDCLVRTEHGSQPSRCT